MLDENPAKNPANDIFHNKIIFLWKNRKRRERKKIKHKGYICQIKSPKLAVYLTFDIF